MPIDLPALGPALDRHAGKLSALVREDNLAQAARLAMIAFELSYEVKAR